MSHEISSKAKSSRNSVFAELAIYLGGGFVVIATALIASTKWADAPTIFRTGSLALLSTALATTAYFMGSRTGMRLRLTSVLSVGSAIAATAAVALATKPQGAPWLAFTVGCCITLGSFIRYHHEILHIAAFGYLFITGLMILGSVTGIDPEDSPVYGIYWIILAAIWLYISYFLMVEPLLGNLISAATFFLATQFLYFSNHHLISYLSSISAAIVLLWIFLKDRYWPLLLGAVVMTTFTVAEFVGDTLGGSLGALVSLFAVGVALIATALVAIRKLH